MWNATKLPCYNKNSLFSREKIVQIRIETDLLYLKEDTEYSVLNTHTKYFLSAQSTFFPQKSYF